MKAFFQGHPSRSSRVPFWNTSPDYLSLPTPPLHCRPTHTPPQFFFYYIPLHPSTSLSFDQSFNSLIVHTDVSQQYSRSRTIKVAEIVIEKISFHVTCAVWRAKKKNRSASHKVSSHYKKAKTKQKQDLILIFREYCTASFPPKGWKMFHRKLLQSCVNESIIIARASV